MNSHTRYRHTHTHAHKEVRLGETEIGTIKRWHFLRPAVRSAPYACMACKNVPSQCHCFFSSLKAHIKESARTHDICKQQIIVSVMHIKVLRKTASFSLPFVVSLCVCVCVSECVSNWLHIASLFVSLLSLSLSHTFTTNSLSRPLAHTLLNIIICVPRVFNLNTYCDCYLAET